MRARVLRAGVGGAVVAGVAAAVLSWCYPRVRVTGTSMAPALVADDRLLVRRTRRIRPGDLVVVSDPRRAQRWLAKRVAAVARDGSVDVRGDAPHDSTDSRAFGAVPADHVVGRVVYRYAPPHRTGVPR